MADFDKYQRGIGFYIPLEKLREDYRVEETGNPKMPYMLYGKRGAVYGLMRTVDAQAGKVREDGPLYAMSARSGAIAKLGRWGTEWVKE